MFIYGNWSAYDELSDGVMLTEELAMSQFDHLLRLRSLGVRFDCYLMDAFWYEPAGAYRTWRKTTWPRGPERWLAACRENHILPGLWFTANTLFHLDLPSRWRDSIDKKDWGLCLFEGGFLEDFMEVLNYWYVQGIRVFKLDFADFAAAPVGREGEWSAEEAREKNTTAYRAALAKFKELHPEARFLGFNGFDHRECMDRSDHPPGDYIDPRWLEVLDSLYAGDPRPADLPGDFWQSVDFYADCMTRLFESSGIPLDRIDNCGFMAGPTGTCYWRGKENWQESLLLSYARGGKIHVAYGDLSAFTDEDARWWSAIQALFAPFLEQGATEAIGGWPGDGQAFGWKNTFGNTSLITLVNPGSSAQSLSIEGQDLNLVCTNDEIIPLRLSGELPLNPGTIAVFSNAAANRIELPTRSFRREEEILHRTTLSSTIIERMEENSGEFRVFIRQTDLQGNALRTFPSEGRTFPFRIWVTDGTGRRELLPMFDKNIWSGISWCTQTFQANHLSVIEAESSEEKDARLEIRLLARL